MPDKQGNVREREKAATGLAAGVTEVAVVPEKEKVAKEVAVEGAEASGAEGEVKKKKRKVKKLVKDGRVTILAGYNNTILCATDMKGNVLARSSAGASGFSGTKKSTPYAAQIAAERLTERLQPYGMEKINVFVKGIGPGREQAIRGLAKTLDIGLIVDRTAVPHNGCRPRKRRRA